MIRLKVHATCDDCSEKSDVVSVGERGAATFRESRVQLEAMGWLVTQGSRRTICPVCCKRKDAAREDLKGWRRKP